MRTRGFTLLETMLVAGLAGIVLTGLWNVLIQGSRGMTMGSRRLDAVSEFNRVVTYLRRDARSILWKQDMPILLGEDAASRELSFAVVRGATLDGLPVAVPVIWNFMKGAGADGSGELERVYSPGQDGETVTRFFRGELADFRLIKLNSEGEEMDGDDPGLPAFLECRMSHSLGDHIAVRIAMHSRYQEVTDEGRRGTYWFPNNQLRPLPLVFPVVVTRSRGVALITVSGEMNGSALLTTGAEMAAPAQETDEELFDANGGQSTPPP